MSLSEEKIIEVLKACPQEDHTQDGWIWRQRIAWALVIESALREEQAAEIARLRNRVELLEEDIECFHMSMDIREAPIADAGGNRYSMIGRVGKLLDPLREANAELLHAFTDAYNELKEWAKGEGDAYNCPAWNALIAKHGGK